MTNINDHLVLICGESATGKSASLMNLENPEGVWYFNAESGKRLPFIPKTTKNEEFKRQVLDQQGMDNLERWVLNNSGDGNRNNMLLR